MNNKQWIVKNNEDASQIDMGIGLRNGISTNVWAIYDMQSVWNDMYHHGIL